MGKRSFSWGSGNGWDDLDGVKYQIDKDPTSLRWDTMPVCNQPEGQSADGNSYQALAGLRLKQFTDAFRGVQQNVFSICNHDFTGAMMPLPFGSWASSQYLCISHPLIDADPSTPQTEPDCRVVEDVPCDLPGVGGCFVNGYQEDPLVECKDSETKPLDPATAIDDSSRIPDDNRPCWYLRYSRDKFVGCPYAFKNQEISVLRKSGHGAPVNAMLTATCLVCLGEDQFCSK